MSFNIKYFFVVGMLWFYCMSLAIGQVDPSHKVVVANHPIKGIQIKLLSKHIVSNDGVYVYRRKSDVTDWERLNAKPIKRITDQTIVNSAQQDVLDTLTKLRNKDKALDAMIKLANSMTPGQTMEPLVLLTLNLKALEYNTFATYLGVYFEDTSAIINTSYQYKIVAYEKQKAKTLALSAIVKCQKYVTSKPVEQLVIGRIKNSITLKWKIEPDRFFAVNIYRKNNSNWQRVNKYPVPVATSKGVLPPFFFKDDSLTIGNTYNYKIAGIDFFGYESTFSEQVTMELKDIQAPSSATGFKASIKNQDIHFVWDKVADPDVKGFYILMASSLEGQWTRQNIEKIDRSATAWILLNKPPSYYYFKLASVDQSGNESTTPAILIKITDMKPPAAPTNFRASIDTNIIKLTWSIVKEDDIKGYNIYRSALKPDTNEMVLMNASPVAGNMFIDTVPTSLNNIVYYTIRTVDTALNKSSFVPVIALKLKDYSPPQTPFIKSVIQIGNTFQIEFYKASDGDTKNFEIVRTHLNDIKKIVVPSDTNLYSDAISEGEGLYEYTIKAVDLVGNVSKPSNAFSMHFKEDLKLDKPVLHLNYHKNKKQILLDWKSKEGKETLGYIVFIKTIQDTYRPLFKLSKNKTYKVSTSTLKGTYSLQVRQYNMDGSVLYSNTESLVLE